MRWAAHRFNLALLLLALLLTLMAEGPPPASFDAQINSRLVGEKFDFFGWEARALLSKLAHGLVAPQRYMDEPSRRDFFLDYLALIAEIQRVESEIHRIYTDPSVEEPVAETTELRARLAELRAEEDARQLLAEAILEEQAACVLSDEGFGFLGHEFPSPSVHFTALPTLLVISPRDHIENVFSLGLRHGMNAAQREAVEGRIDAELEVSSLVTNIGGLAAYPAMLLELGSLNWVSEVIAHEWTHHYLALRPLGWNYNASAEARTINETVASIVGKEIGRRIVARYYPQLLPPEPEPVPVPDEAEEEEQQEQQQAASSEPPAFDFRLEMRETRIRVDELLEEGNIEEAEAYMEERREEFVAHGYYIRKLNQAYFAFHGSYAAEPGAAGEDPIGPAVRELRARSPDLHTFVGRVEGVTTLAELQTLLGETGQ